MKLKGTPTWLLLPVVVGLVSALAAWFLVRQYVEVQVAQQPRLPAIPEPQWLVVVPRIDLSAGTRLTPELLQLRDLEARSLPIDAIAAEDAESVFERTLAHNVAAGNALQQLHIAPESGGALSSRMPAGMRAFTLAAQNEWTHVQSLDVGDRVDLYAEESNGWLLVGQNISVLQLATDEGELNTKPYRYVTFAVPMLALAHIQELSDDRRLQVVLRRQIEADDAVENESHSPLHLRTGLIEHWRPAQLATSELAAW
ncbi:MAG: Flp pilus assembly protein CpaB [Idiomarina sp.]|nr:Flp pilus assembly protein CpaB [Idiomarina sp.]